MAQTRLDSLPDDLLLDVASELGTARDLSALSATSRRTHQLLRHDGWRDFVRHGFPNSSSSSIRGKADWMGLADRLTYLDRCWERRAFVLHDFQPEAAKRGNRRRPHTSIGGGQSVSFYPSLDARELTRHAGELAAWGVGEDLVVKLADGRGVPSWSRLEGRAAGYAGGFGDVTAVSVIERHEPEVVVGRANGDIQIVAATGHGLGRVTQTLGTAVQDGGGVTPRRSPGQMAVSWTEWNEGTGMLASGKYSTLTLHNLDIGDDGGEGAVPPVSQYDLLDDSPGDELSLVRGVTFLGSDVVACALGSSRRPVRWAKITPTGLEFFDAAANPGPLAYLATQTDVSSDERTTVRAIKPVGHRHNDSLVLTAWDDGTYRLLDVRTPSPYDAVYRDRWNPYDGGSSLAVYGTERFVAGSNLAPNVRFYDFRYPRPYSHTDAMPCSPSIPQPKVPFGRGRDAIPDSSSSCCTWHEQSRHDVWRPDATLHLGDAGYDRVHALAKASDLSDTLYCGMRGAVVEMRLRLAEDVGQDDMTRPAPPGWRAGAPRGKIALAETGVSLCREDEWVQENQGVPTLLHQQRQRPWQEEGEPEARQPGDSRLDSAYYAPE